jgi:hypothetical protein
MSLPEFLYAIAFASYMIGALFAFRNEANSTAVMIMSVAVAADFLITILPALGVESLSMNFEGSNPVVVAGSVMGLLTWSLFVAAALAWWRNKTTLFLGLVIATQLAWFTCYLSFVYGMHVYPAV